MMKVYGADICIDCRNYKAIRNSRGFTDEYIDITEDIGKLKEFLSIRDSNEIFAPVKERGGVGIPLFVGDDGKMTFDIDEAFEWIGQPPVKDEEIAEKPVCDIKGGCR